jgi:hypothetical protein
MMNGARPPDLIGYCNQGCAYNVLDDDIGSGMWEVWGDYDVPLPRPASGDLASGDAVMAPSPSWMARP